MVVVDNDDVGGNGNESDVAAVGPVGGGNCWSNGLLVFSVHPSIEVMTIYLINQFNFFGF